MNEGKVVNDVLNHLRIGMLNATQEDAGTARIFKKLPDHSGCKNRNSRKRRFNPTA